MTERMPRRIVLTLDRGDLDARALQPLLRFAASANAALEAVLVEDRRLQRLAQTPLTRFVHMLGHEEPDLPREALRYAVAARSRRVLRRLQRLHELQPLPWLLREVPCERLVDVFTETSSRDLVVVSWRTDGGNTGEVEQLLAGGWQPLDASTLVINPARAPDVSVLLLAGGHASELFLAAELAQQFRCRLDVVTALQRRDDGPVDDLHERVAALAVQARIHAVPPGNAAALIARAAALRPGTLVVARNSPWSTSLDLLELMSVSRGSLYLHAPD